ncbi:MAG TPA: ABC transporter ATP-binding protein [Thermoplasmata archaeon]|nr:ABC transporter ATP-binding protein [Thermoplasmata archaeon]
MPGELLQVESVTKRFDQVEALSNLSVELVPGTVGLVGPNGSGKTTLLRLLMGLIPPSAGRLSVLGYDPQTDALRVRERVGYMPEHDCLMPDLSAVGFVSFMGRVSGLPREVAISRAHDVLEFVGLKEERYRKIREYSVGMRQRVKLAQAIVHDPPLCFLDEPTSGLDPEGREEMLHLIGVLAKLGGHSFVLSTHLLPDTEGLVDQVLLLNAGRLLAAGPVATLLSQSRSDTVVRVKGDAPAFIAALAAKGVAVRADGTDIKVSLTDGNTRPVFEAAQASHTQIRYLGPSVRTVEDLFLSMMGEPTGRSAP